jgi:hypothetical protein
MYAADAKSPWDALNAAHNLKCDFGPGISTEWKGDQPNSEDARIPVEAYLSDIDFQTGKARLEGNGGSTDVWAKLSPMTVNFVEMSGMWNISMITVYPYYLKGTVDFPAVWSRHQYLADGPLASQFYGTCKVWE